jgi:adenylate kinase
MTSETSISFVKNWLGPGSINIFGLPFSGKDTHGAILARDLNAALIGGGQILRSQSAEHVQKAIAAGKMAPTQEYLSLILPYFSRQEFSEKPLILSSIGRLHGEEQSVVDAAQTAGHPIKAVVYLKITEDDVYARWQSEERTIHRGERHDDAEHVLQTRLKEYYEKTLPVIEYYKNLGLLIEVDGRPPKNDVTQDIYTKLAEKSTR